MKFLFAMVILLGLPALVAAEKSCTVKSSSDARVERAAPVARYAALDQWLLIEPHLL